MHTKSVASHKVLVSCWIILMSMTGFSLWAAAPTTVARLSLWAIVALLAASGVKAIQILWVFLNLRQSTPAWKATFVSFLATIFFIVWSCAGISLYWVH